MGNPYEPHDVRVPQPLQQGEFSPDVARLRKVLYLGLCQDLDCESVARLLMPRIEDTAKGALTNDVAEHART